MCKTGWCTCRVVVLLIKPIAFLTFWLPSPLSLLKLPISLGKLTDGYPLTVRIKRRQLGTVWNYFISDSTESCFQQANLRRTCSCPQHVTLLFTQKLWRGTLSRLTWWKETVTQNFYKWPFTWRTHVVCQNRRSNGNLFIRLLLWFEIRNEDVWDIFGANCSFELLATSTEEKNALYLSVKVFSAKILIGDTIFTSPTWDGTAILRGHPSHAKV